MAWPLYLTLINLLTFGLYWHDKRAAQRPGAARVPVATLLLAGFVGGTPAALAAQRMPHHKTRKQSFQFKFWALTALQIACLVWMPQEFQAALQQWSR